MAKHWSCKNDRHNECLGTILNGGPQRGVEGLAKCKCDCHRKVANVHSDGQDIRTETR